jgi:hypothetical protein
MTSGDEGGGWPDGVGLSRSERDLPSGPFGGCGAARKSLRALC